MFESVDAVKKRATELMNKLSEDLQHCFKQWKIRMERCRDSGGEYIEGENILCNFLIKDVITLIWLFYSHTTYFSSGVNRGDSVRLSVAPQNTAVKPCLGRQGLEVLQQFNAK